MYALYTVRRVYTTTYDAMLLWTERRAGAEPAQPAAYDPFGDPI